jgi:hypothetical protein
LLPKLSTDALAETDVPFDYVEACASKRFVIVGASHAGRLGRALEDLELCVIDLTSPGWKLNEQSVSDTAKQLEEILSEDTDLQTVVIYEIFDNSCYIGVNSGERRQAEKSTSDGRYHITGELSVADRSEFKDIFNSAVPLLRGGGQYQKVIITPLLRYSSRKCCRNPDHITNFGKENYYTLLGAKLADLKA